MPMPTEPSARKTELRLHRPMPTSSYMLTAVDSDNPAEMPSVEIEFGTFSEALAALTEAVRAFDETTHYSKPVASYDDDTEELMMIVAVYRYLGDRVATVSIVEKLDQ